MIKKHNFFGFWELKGTKLKAISSFLGDLKADSNYLSLTVVNADDDDFRIYFEYINSSVDKASFQEFIERTKTDLKNAFGSSLTRWSIHSNYYSV